MIDDDSYIHSTYSIYTFPFRYNLSLRVNLYMETIDSNRLELDKSTMIAIFDSYMRKNFNTHTDWILINTIPGGSNYNRTYYLKPISTEAKLFCKLIQ
jgi:hypothetical protein